MSSAIASSAMTRPALPRLPRSTSKALQAARNRAAAILSTCKLCADTTDEALNNEVGIATPDREARKRGPAPWVLRKTNNLYEVASGDKDDRRTRRHREGCPHNRSGQLRTRQT